MINISPSLQSLLKIEGAPVTRFRIGVSIPASTLRGFGKRHGVTIDLNYNGGQAFYNYMTRGPGYFAHIDLAIGMPDVWNWGGMRDFLRGLLDSADADNGLCEISITLYGMNLGWAGLWEASFAELLDAIGPNRSSMRFILLAGEWSYKNMQPPTDVNELKSDFFKAKEMAANYGYELGWHGEGKYLWSLPKSTWQEVISWGPRMVDGQLSRSSDPIIGAREAYETGNAPPSATDVLLCCFTMWDREANIPNTPPYCITYEKFAEFVHGATDRFDATNGAYPQSLVFEVMPETFNDVEGVDCPYLDWWFGEGKIADTYNLRTSRTPPIPIPKPPPVPTPSSPFPPYPVGVKIENEDQNLPPFQVQTGGQFYGSIYARNLHTWRAMGGVPVDVYLAKVDLKSGIWNSYPLTREQYAQKIFVGRVTTRSDGWAFFNFTAPSEAGKYILIAQVPRTETTLEGVSDFVEFLLVATKTHRVEIRTNTKIKLAFGPSAFGPPWQGVDPERWIEPEESLWGYCSEMEWKFIAPSKVTDSQGKTWVFSHWEDGSTNPVRTIIINRDLVLEAYYSEPSIKSKINVYGYVRDDRGYPLEGVSVTVSSPVDQVSAETNSQGGYAVTLSVNGPGDTVRVTTTYHGRSGSACGTVPSGASGMQIDVTVPRTSTSISCSVSPSMVTIGGSVTVSGVISPAVEGAMVTLTYIKPNTSSFTRTVITSQNGAYSDNYTPDQLGSYSIVTSWSGNEDYVEAMSLPTSFMVNKNPSSISISLDSTSISIGSTLRIGGTLSPPLSNVKVMLSYRVKGGNWVPVKNLTTNPDGQFSYMWTNTPRSEGEYELRASWLGDDYYEGSSCTVLFIVTEFANPPASDFSIITEEPYSMPVSGELGENVTITLPAPNFTLTVDPKVVKLLRISRYNTTVAIRISSLSNYTIEPLLKINRVPEGIKARLDQEALRIQRLESNSTILVISTGEIPPEQDNYSIVIECSCMNVTASELVTLNMVDRRPTVVRINATPTSIQYGDTLFIKGLVWPPHLANILVSIMLKNGTEIDTAEFSTDETGEFSLSRRVMLAPDEYVIKVLCEEDVFYFESFINVTLRVVKASIIITLISNSTRAGSDEPVFFSGIVATTKGEPIQNMNLTILISGETGTILVPAKTSENGTYTAVISRLSMGKYEAVSLIEGNDYYEPARSVPVKIEVLHPVSRTLNDILYPIVSIALIILALITSVRVIVSTMHEIREERNYRVNRKRYKK